MTPSHDNSMISMKQPQLEEFHFDVQIDTINRLVLIQHATATGLRPTALRQITGGDSPLKFNGSNGVRCSVKRAWGTGAGIETREDSAHRFGSNDDGRHINNIIPVREPTLRVALD